MSALAPLRIAIIIGSVREGRLGPVVARWMVDQANAIQGIELEVLDLAAIPLPSVMSYVHNSDVLAWAQRLASADAFIVVTSEYNHSFPASLKHAIDLVKNEWQRKPVAFVSYGGMSGGLRAVEQLRLVFAELQSVTIRQSVAFAGIWSFLGDEGLVAFPEHERGGEEMIRDLVWWATVLREARSQQAAA